MYDSNPLAAFTYFFPATASNHRAIEFPQPPQVPRPHPHMIQPQARPNFLQSAEQ